MLAAIALRHPRPTTTDQIVDLIWGDEPPATARKAVQNHVLRIRRAAGSELLHTENGAYLLGPHVTLDTEILTDAIGEAAAAQRRHDHSKRRAVLESALVGLTGVPFADLREGSQTAAARRHIHEVHAGAAEGLAESLLAQGAIRDAIELLARLTAESPYRERQWWLLMLAQYRAGQRRDALATFGEARQRLVAGAGIEPGDELRRLERLIGADDPMLMTPAVLDVPVQSSITDVRRSEHFVGRERELERLGTVFEQVLTEGPSFVVVEGEAGIGKTTLAREFGASATEKARVVWGPCDAAPATPLQPFGRALDELLDSETDDFPSWLSHDPASLAAVVPRLASQIDARSDEVGDAGRYRLFDAVADALVSAAVLQPLIVILDDFQLAPLTTRRLVSRCMDSDAPLLLLATWRTGPGSPPWVESAKDEQTVARITLSGLSEESIARWLVAVLGNDTETTEAAGWLHSQTEGNPLFVRELTTTLVDSEVFASGPGSRGFSPPDRVPDALREVLLDRVRGLAADTVAFLRAASVLGTRFRPTDLQALVDTSPARQIAEATSAGILKSGPAADEVQFTHDLVRRALYDTLAPGTRVELHDLAAQATEADGGDSRLAEIAWHRLAATPIDARAAVEAARRAADAAIDLFAFDEAARFYEGAQTAATALGGGSTGVSTGTDAERAVCELGIRRGDALRRAGDPDNIDVLTRAAARAEALGDGDLLARAALALCQLGPTTETGGSDAFAAELADRALERAPSADLRAAVAATASLVHSTAGESARCRELFERAEEEARRAGDPQVLCVVLPFAYLSLARPGDLDRRSAIANELIELATRLRHLPTEWEGHQLRFSVQLARGDRDLTDSFDRLEALTEILKEPTRVWTVRCLAASVAHVRGDLDEAERQITASLELSGTVAASRVFAAYGAELLGIRSRQGRLGELADTIASLVVEQPRLPAWHAALAWIAAVEGDRSTACREFDLLAADDFSALADDFTWTSGMYALARSAATILDASRAEAVYRRLEPCGGLMSWFGTGTFGPLDQVLGECALAFGDRTAAERHLTTARSLSSSLDAPLLAREAEEALEHMKT